MRISDPERLFELARRGRLNTKRMVVPCVLLRRGGRDSNPRLSLKPSTHLAGEPNRPLWHLPSIRLLIRSPAEGEGFEPTLAFTKPVFKTGALNHSAIPPFPDLLKPAFAWIGAGILPYLRMGCNTRLKMLRRTALLKSSRPCASTWGTRDLVRRSQLPQVTSTMSRCGWGRSSSRQRSHWRRRD